MAVQAGQVIRAGGGTGGGTGSNATGPTSLVFQLTSGKAYNPDGIYIDSVDAKGHYERIRIKLTPRMQYIIEAIVRENDELRTPHDFIRNALFHEAHKWLMNRPSSDQSLVQLAELDARNAQTDALLAQRIARREDLRKTQELVDQMIEDQDWYAVKEELDRIEQLELDDTLPEGVRMEYANLWQDMHHALSKARTKQMRVKASRI